MESRIGRINHASQCVCLYDRGHIKHRVLRQSRIQKRLGVSDSISVNFAMEERFVMHERQTGCRFEHPRVYVSLLPFSNPTGNYYQASGYVVFSQLEPQADLQTDCYKKSL